MASVQTFDLLCTCGCICQDNHRRKQKKKMPYFELMQKFNESKMEKCRHMDKIMENETKKIAKTFPTGTVYEGMWNKFGMCVYGTYKMPHGVTYKGELDDDGLFHGEGELIYPNGDVLRGRWDRGNFSGERQLFFRDSVQFVEQGWTYCRMPDRRYAIEHKYGIQPSGESFMTAEQLPREIPSGYYDCGEGFYSPSYKCVYTHEDVNQIVRSPYMDEQKWIVKNCAKFPDAPVGPIPDFYERFYKPTSTLDPAYKGDSYDSPESSNWNYETMSTISAFQRWAKFHSTALDYGNDHTSPHKTSQGTGSVGSKYGNSFSFDKGNPSTSVQDASTDEEEIDEQTQDRNRLNSAEIDELLLMIHERKQHETMAELDNEPHSSNDAYPFFSSDLVVEPVTLDTKRLNSWLQNKKLKSFGKAAPQIQPQNSPIRDFNSMSPCQSGSILNKDTFSENSVKSMTSIASVRSLILSAATTAHSSPGHSKKAVEPSTSDGRKSE